MAVGADLPNTRVSSTAHYRDEAKGMTLKRFGHYRLLRLLAEARCEVYEAEDAARAHRMAVKILPQWYAPPESRDRLQRDMAVARRLRDPHIVPIDAWGEIDGRFYLQMPLIDGTDLQTLLDRDGPLSPKEAIDIVGQIAEALDATHGAGLVHSGVAPENILVAGDGRAYLLGLGYRAFLTSCEESHEVDTDPRLEKPHVGWSPEKSTRGEVTDRGDVHGLACVLYASLTGEHPYRGSGRTETFAKILTETPPPVSRSRPGVPAALDDVVARGMARDPADRYASAGELARAAHDALNGAASEDDHEQFGQYRLVRLLADGRTKVHEAEDTATQLRVVVKIFAPAEIGDVASQRIQRESDVLARVVGSVTEPHLVSVQRAGEVDGQLYLQLPYIDGVDLQTLLDRDGPLSVPRAVDVVEQIAAALDAAHAAGLMCREVMPAKILLTHDDFAYLLLQPSLEDPNRDADLLDDPPNFAYFAPEKFQTGDDDASAARYSLACVLYACLTGSEPFPGSPEQQITGHLKEHPPKPSDVNPAVPHALNDVVARGMAKAPENRFASAAELAAAARDALAFQLQDTVEAGPGPTVEIATPDLPIDAQPTALPQQLIERFRRDPGGQITIARYTLLELLDRGAGAAVFRARVQSSGALCTLKVVPRTAVASDELDKPWPLADVRALRHRNIVALRDVTPIGECFLLASEYCVGDNVAGLIRRLGPLTVYQAVPLALQCLDALAYAHSATQTGGSIGVMHRSINPGNILLTWSGNDPITKLADFGLAAALDLASATGNVPQDLAFVPRPQLLPARTPAREVDVWRLAACLYYMLTGFAPRHSPSRVVTMDDVVNTPAMPIRQRNPNVPPRVAAVIDEALVDNPQIRIGDAGTFARALHEATYAANR